MKVWKCKHHKALYREDRLWKYYPENEKENLQWIVNICNELGYAFKDSLFSKNYVWKTNDFVLIDIPDHYLIDDPENSHYLVGLAEGKPPIWI